MKEKKQGSNYLVPMLGGIFLIAIALIIFFSAGNFSPLEGCVGILRISGPIITQDIESTLFSDSVKGSETIAKEIEAADERQEVKSVLVLIDSPGGSVVASREIYNALVALNKSKVAYINELAASGGYYAAAGTDYIVANPDAITGSIGARATFADMSGLFAKVGYNETTIKSGAMKDIGSSSRPMTEQERAVIESIINESFAEFRSAVELGRRGKLNRALFEEVLDARIMSGRQAKRIGLVDSLGDKKDALQKAALLGGIPSDDPKTCDLSISSSKKSLLGSLGSEQLDLLLHSASGWHLSYQ